MNQHPLPPTMVAPSQRRRGWNVLQIMVTRACDLACTHCTQGSNLAGKPVMMTPEQFEQACISLEGYFGIVGMFGGNPAMHPQFDTLCEIMRRWVPFERRGLWCNNLRGKGAIARMTFNPHSSNINVHLNSEAYAEFERDWPEAIRAREHHARNGLTTDSIHSSPWVAIKDVIPDEAERWRMIGQCDVNQNWSALIGIIRGELRAFFCEIAYAQAALHADNPNWDNTEKPMPDTGLAVTPGWWRAPMAAYEQQARLHCQACGIPMRRAGQLAVGGTKEEFSETHRWIARPKIKSKPVEFIESIGMIRRPERPATEYLAGVTPGFAH